MAQRASWRGFLRIGELTMPIALYGASTQSERIRLHTVNRATGHRVRRENADAATGEQVARDDQTRGYEVASGEYITLEPQEIA